MIPRLIKCDILQYREANEEVGLPLGSPHIHTLCQLRPFTSSSKLVVTPVIALLTDLSVLDTLQRSENEVDRIFDHPLEAILEPPLAAKEPLAEMGSNDWFYRSAEFQGSDYHVSVSRNHRNAQRLC